MPPLSPTAVFDFPEASRNGAFLDLDDSPRENISNFRNPKNGYLVENTFESIGSSSSQFDSKIRGFDTKMIDFDRNFQSNSSNLYTEFPIECIDQWESRNSFDPFLGTENGVHDSNRSFSAKEYSNAEYSQTSTSTSDFDFLDFSKRTSSLPDGHPTKRNLRRTSSLPTNIKCQDAEKACDFVEMEAARTRIKEAASRVWEAEQVLTALRLQQHSGDIEFPEKVKISRTAQNPKGSKNGKISGERRGTRQKKFEFEDILGTMFDDFESDMEEKAFESSKKGSFSRKWSKKEGSKIGGSKSTIIRSMWVWMSGMGQDKSCKV